jgi:hypothetical protein
MAINDDKKSPKKSTDDNYDGILASELDDDEIKEMKAWMQLDERTAIDKIYDCYGRRLSVSFIMDIMVCDKKLVDTQI